MTVPWIVLIQLWLIVSLGAAALIALHALVVRRGWHRSDDSLKQFAVVQRALRRINQHINLLRDYL